MREDGGGRASTVGADDQDWDGELIDARELALDVSVSLVVRKQDLLGVFDAQNGRCRGSGEHFEEPGSATEISFSFLWRSFPPPFLYLLSPSFSFSSSPPISFLLFSLLSLFSFIILSHLHTSQGHLVCLPPTPILS